MQSAPSTSRTDPAAGFAATRWSLVAAAGRDSPDSRRALTELCLRYWYPVYVFVRRRGHPPEDAQRLSRRFFAHLLRTQTVQRLGESGGRFRDFLLGSLREFLQGSEPGEDGCEAASAPPPPDGLERRYRDEPEAARDAEIGFLRSYAAQVLGNALDRLAQEAREAQRNELFDALAPYLASDPGRGELDALARTFELPPVSLLLALKRLRQRYRELCESELSETVSSAADLEAERKALARALART
jgi:hypothetical protein